MEKRLGFVGIIIDDRKKSAPSVNGILTEFGDEILARTGLPHVRGECSVITLIVDISTDRLGAMTGRLGTIAGVTVKSALTK